jgi:hypothetical protein
LPAADECYEVALSTEVPWASSGSWLGDGGSETLLLSDPLVRQILLFDKRGQLTGRLAGEVESATGAEAVSLVHPASLRQVGADEVLVLDGVQQKILELDSQMEVSRESAAGQPVAGDRMLRRLYDWAPLAGGGLVGFADVEGPPEVWHRAFVYGDGSQPLTTFGELVPLDPLCNLYLRDGLHYVASLGDVGYALRLEPDPSLVEFTPGGQARELPSFPEDFHHAPLLERDRKLLESFQFIRQETELLMQIERAPMAAGLYAWDGGLYLLAKGAAEMDGSTPWWLVQLDPRDGSERARVRLPTDAAHLTLVPGDEHWALVEKGPVSGVGPDFAPYMSISSMVLVPAAWIQEPERGGLDRQQRVRCPELPR